LTLAHRDKMFNAILKTSLSAYVSGIMIEPAMPKRDFGVGGR
jgi:hypothetical protein